MFGELIESDLLINISHRPGSVSIFLRIAYSLILLLHLPYYFFTVKEYILVMVDEVFNRSMSSSLEQKLSDFYKKKESKKEEYDDRPVKKATPDTPAS